MTSSYDNDVCRQSSSPSGNTTSAAADIKSPSLLMTSSTVGDTHDRRSYADDLYRFRSAAAATVPMYPTATSGLHYNRRDEFQLPQPAMQLVPGVAPNLSEWYTVNRPSPSSIETGALAAATSGAAMTSSRLLFDAERRTISGLHHVIAQH